VSPLTPGDAVTGARQGATARTPLQSALDGLAVGPGTVGGVLAVAVAAYVLARVVSTVVSWAAERSAERRISIQMVIPVAKFLIYGGAVAVVLGPLLQLSAAQLIAVSSLLAAAIAFGLRDLFAGVVGGLVVILEKPYQVGDKVEIGDHYGEVTDISLRSTELVTADDTAVVVPNATLFTENVANANDGRPEMMAVAEVAIAPEADVERAMAIMEEALVTSKYVYVDDDHPVVVRVEDATYYRTVRGKAYVGDLRDEFAFTSDVTRRTLAAFEREGIGTPEVPDRLPEG